MDPTAEEFWPNFTYPPNQTTLFHTPQIYFLAPPAYVSTNYPPSAHVSHSVPAYLRNSQPPAYMGSHPPPAYVSCSQPAYVSSSQPVYPTGYLQAASPQVIRQPPPSPTSQVGGVPAEATRTLLLSSVPRGASESGVRRELEVFGDVRAVEMERARREGIVTVHFYDLRHAIEASRVIQEQNMQHQRAAGTQFGPSSYTSARVWAEFVIPNMAGVPDGYNQGALVVYNLHPNFPNMSLRELFEPFGDVKELKETPMKRHQRFIEFYDVRDATKAYSQLNGKEIHGNQIVIEFSRPGEYKKQFHQKIVARNPNFRVQNALICPRLIPQNSCDGKPSSHGSSNGSEKCLPKRKPKKDKQVCSGNQKTTSKGKGWSYKGRQPRCLDSRFLINEDGIVDSSVSDSRTTVMIKNIPNKYSQKLLMDMLDNHCIHFNEEIAKSGNDEPLSSYDFIYLPIDFINKCNVGYGFVNMTSPMAALRLYKAFHHQTWEVYNSKKICEVTYARLQGLEALKDHFRNSKFPCAAEEYLPVVFSPPRDGRQLTNPFPVAARASTSHSFSSSEEITTSSHQTLTDDDNGANEDDDSGGSSSQ